MYTNGKSLFTKTLQGSISLALITRLMRILNNHMKYLSHTVSLLSTLSFKVGRRGDKGLRREILLHNQEIQFLVSASDYPIATNKTNICISFRK
jgi:hypothetical protein